VPDPVSFPCPVKGGENALLDPLSGDPGLVEDFFPDLDGLDQIGA
jgi:hypothetical protein